MRNLFLFIAAAVAVAILGMTVTLWRVDDGIDRFRENPLALTVARRAYVMAQVHRDNIFQRLLSPVATVVAVKRFAGHCLDPVSEVRQAPASNRPGMPALMPGPAQPDAAALREYKAQVRFYTFFAVPVADVSVSCGGDGASERIQQAR